MRIIVAVALMLALSSFAFAQEQSKLVLPGDVEVSFDGGGSWTPVQIVSYEFTTGTPGNHHPFSRFGRNITIEADITGTIAGDTDTLARIVVIVDDPGINPDTIWITGWVHWKFTRQIGEDQDSTPFSEMQNVDFRRDKKPHKPKMLKA